MPRLARLDARPPRLSKSDGGHSKLQRGTNGYIGKKEIRFIHSMVFDCFCKLLPQLSLPDGAQQ